MKTLKYLILFALVLSTSCVQKTPPKEITVRVNMTDVENPKNVGLRGQHPLSWEETTFLQDEDGDNIYEGEFKIYTASNAIEFKFVNNDEFELKDKSNRILTFEYKPETILYEAYFNDTTRTEITRQ